MAASGFTPAQRAYLRALVRREREILRDEITLALNDALRSEAQTVMLAAMTRDHPVPPSA